MKVIDHQQGSWFLLKDQADFYLDVHCSVSFASFSILLELSPEEKTSYQTEGRKYMDGLAGRLQYSSSTFSPRNAPRAVQDLAHQTIMLWKQDMQAH